MYKHYLLNAWKRVRGQGAYSIVITGGLAIGLAAFTLIGLYIAHQFSYDRYHTNFDRIYRFSRDYYAVDGMDERLTAANGPAAGPLLVQDFSQIEKTARIGNCGGQDFGVLIVRGDIAYFENGYVTADNTLFDIFDVEWISGDKNEALVAPLTVVLTESAATKYFGTQDPMGETLLLENRYPMEVTGVIGDLPRNTHLEFTMIGSVLNATVVGSASVLEGWGLNCYHTYALATDDFVLSDVQSQSDEFFERHMGEGGSRRNGFSVQPLSSLHLWGAREGELSQPGSVTSIFSFSAIGIVVLILACINFVNLSTARANLRATEVGVRKAVGALRLELLLQFMSESLAGAVIAALIGVALAAIALLMFGALSWQSVSMGMLVSPAMLVLFCLSVVAVGLVAGSYPALYLSSFRPISVLRGDVSRGKASSSLRKFLVITQFTMSVTLIIVSIVVYQQLKYAQEIDLGYDKDNIVLMQGSPTRGVSNNWDALRQAWLSHPEISDATGSAQVPGMTIATAMPVALGVNEPIDLPILYVEFGFFETYKIALLGGRFFSEDFGVDRVTRAGGFGEGASATFVLSAAAVRRLGLDALGDIVGRTISVLDIQGTVVGVVDDVHFESLRSEIEPVVYMIPARNVDRVVAPIQFASLRVSGNNVSSTFEYIDAVWKQFEPEQAVTRRLLDQDLRSMYEPERRQATLLLCFSGLAIFIACLGVFGLATFAVEQRRKEIGIRKAMGGAIQDIVRLFVRECGALVLVASIVAWPIAYIVASRWLERFAYRVDLALFPFVVGSAIALAVAVLTIVAATLKVACERPVQALRYE